MNYLLFPMKRIHSPLIFGLLAVLTAHGSPLYYDPTNPGWIASEAWSTTVDGEYDTSWLDGSLATFNFAASGTHNVTLAADISVGGMNNSGLGTVQINGSGGNRMIDFNGSSVSGIFALNTAINSTGNVTVNSGAVFTSHGTATLPHVGTVTNNGTVSWSNGTRLSADTHFVVNSGIFNYSSTAAVTVGSLDVTGGQFRIGWPSGAGQADLTFNELQGTGGALTLRGSNNTTVTHTLRVNQDTDTTFTGSIAGEAPMSGVSTYLTIVKGGTGALSLAGTISNFKQGLTVNDGILYLNSATTSFDNLSGDAAITVASGGALGGTGTISVTAGKDVLVADGGTLVAGLQGSAGTTTFALGVAANLDLTTITTATDWLRFDLGSDVTAGSTYDQIVVGGGLLDIGTGILDLDSFDFNFLAGFGEGTYTLLAADTLAGTLGSQTSGMVGGYLASLMIDDNAIILSTVVIPEPGLAAALFAATALAVAGLRRRRLTPTR